MRKNDLKYVIFKTAEGFFGLLADDKGLIRSTLPAPNFGTAKKYLLVGMFRGASEYKQMYPDIQKSIKSYYNGFYAELKKARFVLNWEELTDFSKKVLNVCKRIPPGQTLTYSQLAKKAGFPKAARAAGSVLAKNPLPLLVPCHRVIRSDGKIGNFSAAGGSRTKKRMIEFEKWIVIKAQRHK